MKAKYSLLPLGFIAFCLVAGAQAAENVVTPPMVGDWRGSARIVVIWTRQTNLPVNVRISSDATVTGQVGDATLLNGRLSKNRGWIGRKLNLATDYIITGDLSGAVIAAEGIKRDRVLIPVNFTGTNFTGGVHTSGSKMGGKEHMILSAGGLKLRKE